MRITVAALRLWIVALTVLLLLGLAGVFLYARYKTRLFLADIPGKLDGTIIRQSHHFTYSQSVKGHTAFTIQAADLVQFTGGTSANLKDVVITLYGAQGDRNDRIQGSDFTYDQKAGIVTAKGEVQIDLHSAASAPGASGTPVPASKDAAGSKPAVQPENIHIKTSNLVFNQNTQVATTSQYVEFNTPKGDGHSTGATYDVQKGLLVLDSAVQLNSDRDGKPILVHASHTEFLRGTMQAFLLHPVTDYQAEHTSSDQAIVYFRPDGSAEHIDAQGNVHLRTDQNQEMTAGSARILLDQRSQPQRADAKGGLNFVSNGDPHQMHGNAVEGTLTFSPGGTLSHAQARDAVSFVDQQHGLQDDPQGSSTRELRASQVDIDFLPDAQGHAVADKVLAVGQAAATLHTIRSKGPAQNTTIKGDQLLANLENGRAIRTLHGAGHTSVLDLSPTGASSLTSGDTLQVNFVPSPAAARAPRHPRQTVAAAGVATETAQIESVLQEGHVVIVQTPAPAAPGAAQAAASPTHATAQRADYTASSQQLRLTGSPRVNDGETDLSADVIDYNRDTHRADASGSVKVTYLQPHPTLQPHATPAQASPAGFGGEGPTHVIAAAAVLDQARGVATFRGQARLWQGANSVAAPIIELSRNPQILKAYGEPSAAGSVTTILAAESSPAKPQNHQPPQAAQPPAGVYRVHSRQLLYLESDRKATFTGAVAAEDPYGIVHADTVEVFLLAANPPITPSAAPAPATAGRIERVLATGHVVLQQTGRRGVGEKLLYTAQNGKFVLTGTAAVPPRMYDQAHGTVSGEALIFNSQDDSVSVTGGQSRAVTDTRTAR